MLNRTSEQSGQAAYKDRKSGKKETFGNKADRTRHGYESDRSSAWRR